MIPKVIHYCWLSGDKFPPLIEKCFASWKQNLSGYDFLLWDTKRFNLNDSIWVKQAFEERKYAFAADYLRLFAVYNFGGKGLLKKMEVLILGVCPG
jgi:mannosyltransferase OCH1-like enzyme